MCDGKEKLLVLLNKFLPTIGLATVDTKKKGLGKRKHNIKQSNTRNDVICRPLHKDYAIINQSNIRLCFYVSPGPGLSLCKCSKGKTPQTMPFLSWWTQNLCDLIY